MRLLFKLTNVLAKIVILCGKAAAWALIPLMMIIVLDVILRRFFVIGSVRLQEAEWHLHAILFMLCLGYAYVANAHVRIELMRGNLSGWGQALIELIGGAFLLLPLCWMLIANGMDLVERSYAIGEGSPHPSGLPHRWAIKSVIPLGFSLLAISGLAMLLRSLAFLFGSRQLRHEIVAQAAFEERTIAEVERVQERTV